MGIMNGVRFRSLTFPAFERREGLHFLTDGFALFPVGTCELVIKAKCRFIHTPGVMPKKQLSRGFFFMKERSMTVR